MAPWREMNGLQGLFIILVMEKERVQLSNEQRVSQYLTRTLQKSVALSLLWLCVRNKGDLPLGQYRGEKEEKKKKCLHFRFIFISFSLGDCGVSCMPLTRLPVAGKRTGTTFQLEAGLVFFFVFYSEAESLMKKVSACVCVARFPLCRHLFCSANEMLHIYEGPDNIRQVHRHTQRTRFQKHATHLFTFQPFSTNDDEYVPPTPLAKQSSPPVQTWNHRRNGVNYTGD